jgi:hypothetical protein
LIPSLRPALSRPLRELLDDFLCAMRKLTFPIHLSRT